MATVSPKLSYSHYVELLPLDNVNKIQYYIQIVEEQNLSVAVLREKIKSKEYEIKYYIRPTLYLESNVEIIEGNGSENKPYIINL